MTRAAVSIALLALLAGCGKPGPSAVVTPRPAARLSIPPPVDEYRFDFEEWKEAEWSPSGAWQAKEAEDAVSGRRVLERVALDASSPAVIWCGEEFADVEVSVKYRFLGAAKKTEVGIVLRQAEGAYYVARIRDQGQAQFNGCEKGKLDNRAFFLVPPVSKGAWRTLSAVAIGDQHQAQIDGVVCWTARDARFKKGRVGLWWVGESAVQVDDFVVRARALPLDAFEGLDWDGVAGQSRQRFFAWANREACPCGSGRTLTRCRKAGCEQALERGRDVLEQCEEQ